MKTWNNVLNLTNGMNAKQANKVFDLISGDTELFLEYLSSLKHENNLR